VVYKLREPFLTAVETDRKWISAEVDTYHLNSYKMITCWKSGYIFDSRSRARMILYKSHKILVQYKTCDQACSLCNNNGLLCTKHSSYVLDIIMVRSDKYRTGIITIVPVRIASVKI